MKISGQNKIWDFIKNNENLFLISFILLVAIILRFQIPFEIPYMNDEFSALFRTKFSSFSELIEKGVKVDGHPAGIQVFLYYWTKLFGYSELVVKLPFIVFGVISVFLIYKVGKKWFNPTVGLICASFLATLQYPIMYSQIARPYISGLFFSLLMIYYWDKVIFQPNKTFYKNSIIYVISGSLCAYNHHFSLLFTGIVGITGLFLINKKYIFKYIIVCVAIFILYIPHLPIFFYQLKLGGIEGWLGKPHNDFIISYIKFIFHFSIYVFCLVAGLFLFGLINKNLKNNLNKFTIISICWFLIPFLIGFFYSIYINSVLQYSVLIFSFPLLLFFLFGHIPDVKYKYKILIVLLICAINTLSLVYERQHYKIFYKSPSREILILTDNAIKKYGKENCISFLEVNKNISRYYTKKYNLDTNFIWLDNFTTKKDLINFLQKNKKNYLTLGCLSQIEPDIIPIILEYYPYIYKNYDFYNGSFYIFSVIEDKKFLPSNIYESTFSKENKTQAWTEGNKLFWNNSITFQNNPSYYIDSTQEYSPTFSFNLFKIITNKNNFIDISVEVFSNTKLKNVLLVSSLESDGKTIDWRATNLNDYMCDTNRQTWTKIYHTIKLSDTYLNYSDVVLKVFIWNSKKENFYFADFKVRTRIGNPIVYGLYEKIL